jgi:hypothetical protein
VDERVEVLEDVLVHCVTVEGDDVHVDLYGSVDHLCGTVTFTFADPRQRRRMVASLRRWARTTTPLVMTSNGKTISLQDAQQTLGADLIDQ